MAAPGRDRGGFWLATSYAGRILVSMFLGYQAGGWLDRQTGWGPLFLVAGLLGGIFLGLATVMRDLWPPRDP